MSKQKSPAPIKLVIDRKKWARGGGHGNGTLLDSSGQMCCLGFAGLQCGVHKAELRDICMPHSVSEKFVKKNKALWGSLISKMTYKGTKNETYTLDSELADSAADINDRDDITDKQREARLIKLFKKSGIVMEFVN